MELVLTLEDHGGASVMKGFLERFVLRQLKDVLQIRALMAAAV